MMSGGFAPWRDAATPSHGMALGLAAARELVADDARVVVSSRDEASVAEAELGGPGG